MGFQLVSFTNAEMKLREATPTCLGHMVTNSRPLHSQFGIFPPLDHCSLLTTMDWEGQGLPRGFTTHKLWFIA